MTTPTLMTRRFDENTERLERELEELEALSADTAPPSQSDKPAVPNKVEDESPNEPQDDNLDNEEKTYKKRYGDLRRHSQKQINELKQRVEDLRKSATTNTAIPTSVEEIKEWATKNPHAASIIRALAGEEAESKSSEVVSKLARLEEMSEQIAREKEEGKIVKSHPDFYDLQKSDDFHDWAEGQPKTVQDMVYDGSAADVIWAITQYKREKNIATKTADREAAKATNKSTKSSVNDRATGKTFSESDVQRMSLHDYEKHEEAIKEAMANGTFVYDITGAAR